MTLSVRLAGAALGLVLAPVSLMACSEAVDPHRGTISSDPSVLSVPVPEGGRAFVDLRTRGVVSEPAATGWDLAFEGIDVFTNGGLSGPGQGGAFGPLDIDAFETGEVPDVPFVEQDEAGGPFVDWYAYDENEHQLWSRYHVYGVRDGDARYAVQILGYYGEVAGAPVSAVYQLRYAAITPSGRGPTQTLSDVDATGGGVVGELDARGTCLDLGTGDRLALTPDEARASSAWHLCFRRDRVTVNGGLSGSRGVVAVDLDAREAASETLDEVRKRTADSELSAFASVSFATLADPALAYRGDAIRSAFSDRWLVSGARPLAPEPAAWLVVDALGARHLVAFARFEGATNSSPGRVELHHEPVD